MKTVLVVEGFSIREDAPWPMFTNGMPALLCRSSLQNETAPQITLFGTSVPAENWNIREQDSLIAYFFRPFTLGPVFTASAQKLKEKPIDINLWNAQKAMALRLQLSETQNSGSKIGILDHFIHQQILNSQRECEIIVRATDRIMLQPDTEVLSLLLHELQLTERTFQRMFKKYVGVTPGQYRRICQFYSAFTQLKDKRFDKLTDIAYHHGYFDQSHYIRSFKEFTDTTPNEYLQFGLTKKNG